MNSEHVSEGLDLGAVLYGVIWGIGAVVLGGLGYAIADNLNMLSNQLQQALPYVIQGIGALMAGVLGARRAGGSGLMHGLLGGLGMILLLSLAHGVITDFPSLSTIAKNGAVSLASGAIGGIIGVNTR